MSNRGDFVGTAPNSGNYIPAPVPADKEDLPVYVNDELLRLGGTVNGVLEGGALPPHSKLPKRFKEGMIMNFSGDVGGGVDSSGVWLYKNAKWWKLIDDPTTITDEIYERIEEIEEEIDGIDQELIDLNLELDNLNDKTLPALQGELDNLNEVALPELKGDLVELDGRFPIVETDISDGAITTPKMVANTILGDRIVTNSLSGDKITANTINGNKITANTINGDRIIANTINGNRVIANTIKGDRIIANTFSGDKIIANTVGADKLVANSITGGKISSSTTITAGSGNKSASLNGSDATWRLYAGSTTPSAAPFRVDKSGNLFATSGTFGGTVKASMVSGDLIDFSVSRLDVTPIGGVPKKIMDIDVDPSDNFNRRLLIGGITLNNPGGGNILVTVKLYEDKGTGPSLVNTLSLYLPAYASATTSSLASVVDSFNTKFYVTAEANVPCNTAQQNVTATIIKIGSSIRVTT